MKINTDKCNFIVRTYELIEIPIGEPLKNLVLKIFL